MTSKISRRVYADPRSLADRSANLRCGCITQAEEGAETG